MDIFEVWTLRRGIISPPERLDEFNERVVLSVIEMERIIEDARNYRHPEEEARKTTESQNRKLDKIIRIIKASY